MKYKFLILSMFLSLSISGTAYAKTSVEDLLEYEPDVQEVTVDYSDKSIAVNNSDTTLKKELGISNASTTTQIKHTLKEAGYTEIDRDGSEVTYRNRFENRRLIVKGSPSSDNIDKAFFNGWSILQYKTVSDAMDAYEDFKSKGYTVFPDEPVKIVANMSKHSSKVENAGAVELGLDKMQDIGTKDVTVAVMDTGFTDSAWFEDRILAALNFSGEADTTDTWEGGSGHGTGVASVIVDATGSHVKVLPMKVTGKDGTGVQTSMVAAFEHIFEQKDADVINICLGWQCSTTDKAAACTFWTEVIDRAVNEYHIPVVVASGNEGTKDTCYPANLDAVWTVGSLGFEEGGVDYNTISDFSNYGNVDFVARGLNVPIVNAQGDSVLESGTSVSAPLISAMAANFKTKYNYVTCAALYDVMKSICEDLGEKGYDEYYGWGRPVYVDGCGYTCPDGCDFVETSRKNATCVAEGLVVSHCSRCGLEHEEILGMNASAHTGYSFSFTDATCTEPSCKVKKCKSCKAEISRTVLSAALGHHIDSQSDFEEDSADGKEIVSYHSEHCDRCDKTFQTEISRKPKQTDNSGGIVEEETTQSSSHPPATETTAGVEKVSYPKKPKISSLKNKSGKKLTIVCDKQSGVRYVYQYSTSKKFKNASSKRSGSYKITVSVKKGKKYYVRVRTYKTVSGKTVQSPWSKVKSIKIKK